MKWKELMKRKRLLFSLVAVATIATSFVLFATMQTTTTPLSGGTSIPSSDTPGGDLQEALGVIGSGAPSGSFTSNQLAGNSRDRHGHGGTGFAPVLDDASPSTQLADNSDVDSNLATNADADQVVRGSDGKGSDTSPDDFTPILLANNAYPKYDYDLQATEGGGGVRTASDTSSGSVINKEPPSHVPEPASMLLLGSALVGVAVFGRKLRKA